MLLIAPTYLQDSSGQVWLLDCDNNALIRTTPVTGVPSVPYVTLNDLTVDNIWQVSVNTSGFPVTTAVSSPHSPAQFLVRSPNGTAYAISVSNGLLQTSLASACFVQFGQMQNDLAARLADPGMVFWIKAELQAYIVEALRTWNALTEIWVAPCVLSANSAYGVWYDLSTMLTSPRMRTLADTDLCAVMEYHLLEPASGGVWTGTSQFAISDLQGALQRRQDELIQMTACHVAQMSISLTPNTTSAQLPDSVLEPVRMRYVPADPASSPVTLTREDTLAFDGFEPDHLQSPGVPQAWSVIAETPLTVDSDVGPNAPGSYDLIAIESGGPFTTPAGTLLGVPDDWSWLIKWGALADLLGRDSEATDRERAAYCLKRYEDGIKIMQHSNWILSATIDGVPVDTPSMREMDGFSPEWEDDPNAWQSIVTAGMDFIAACPVPSTDVGVSLILVGNAPIPVNDTDCVQVLRDTYDTLLDYAQVLASFKMGGAEFAATKDLEKKFYQFAMQNNKRLAKLGIFSDVIHSEGRRQEMEQPR